MNFSSKIYALILIIRPLNCLITFFSCVISSIVCLNSGNIGIIAYYAALTAALTAASGNVINDITDLAGDRINHPERVLPKGIISKNSAIMLYLFLIISSSCLSLFLSATLFVLNFTVILLLLLYSLKLKKLLFVGNLLVALLTGLVFIYGGIAVNSIYYAIIPAVFAFLINLIREVVKDIEDLEGDTKEGIITFSSKYGMKKTKILLIVLASILIILSLVPFIVGFYNIYYGLIIVLLIDPFLTYFIWKIKTNNIKLPLKRLSFLLKLNMIFGIIAIYVGR